MPQNLIIDAVTPQNITTYAKYNINSKWNNVLKSPSK